MSYWSAKRIVLNEHTVTYLSITFITPITQTPLPMQVPPLLFDKQSVIMNCQVLKAWRLEDSICPRSCIWYVCKTSSKIGNTPQSITTPATGHRAAKTTEADPANGPAMRKSRFRRWTRPHHVTRRTAIHSFRQHISL